MHVAAVATATATAKAIATETTTVANNGFTHACATDSGLSVSLLHLLLKRVSSPSVHPFGSAPMPAPVLVYTPAPTGAQMQFPLPAADALLQFML